MSGYPSYLWLWTTLNCLLINWQSFTYKPVKMMNLPSEVKEAKAVDLASCLAGALYYNKTTLVYTVQQIQKIR